MFIVLLSYLAPIEVIEQHLAAHRNHLEEGYKHNYLIASGPQNPRTGGVLLSQLTDRISLEEFLAQDPFIVHKLATYAVIEFTPVKSHPDFASFL
jgi:uncharacterized protein YciI